MTRGSTTTLLFLATLSSLVLLSTIEASQSGSKCPFSPRWSFNATFVGDFPVVVDSSSLPLGAYFENGVVSGFSLDDGSILWQANQTSINDKNQTYALYWHGGAIIGNPPQLVLDYGLSGPDLPTLRGLYFFDLKTGKLNLDVPFDYIEDWTMFMVTPGDIYVWPQNDNRTSGSLYLLKGPDYSLKTPAASYFWPPQPSAVILLQSTQIFLLLVGSRETNTTSLRRLDNSNAKQTGKFDVLWEIEIDAYFPNTFASQDETKLYISYGTETESSGVLSIFRLDLETGKYDWKQQISWPIPEDAQLSFEDLLETEIVDQSTNAKVVCGSAVVYWGQDMEYFAYCVDTLSGNYVFNVSTTALIWGGFKQWLMIYDYHTGILTGYNPFQQVTEGQEPQPGWKMSIADMDGMVYPVDKDPNYVMITTSRLAVARWDIIPS